MKSLLSSRLLTVVLITCIGVALRFVGLAEAPRGYYVDEAAISAQVICVRQSGADLYGHKYPLFSNVLANGYVTPLYLYGGVVWTALFGDSVESFRSMTAFYGALTVCGVLALGLVLFRNREMAWLAAMCAAVSPWGFQFSRIAWDPPLGPCFFVWSLCALFWNTNAESDTPRVNTVSSWLGGILAALAMYSYPPLRAQVPIVVAVLALGALFYDRGLLRQLRNYCGALFVTLIPLAKLTLSGEIQGRFNFISIFNPDYLNSRGGYSLPAVVQLFFSNMAQNLAPHYLFVAGDANLRHSTQRFGEWSWLEIAALVGVVILMFSPSPQHSKRGAHAQVRRKELALVGLLIVGYLAGLVPAALTWDANPHALRSIGAAPFLALFAGWVLWQLVNLNRWFLPLITLLATAFSVMYFSDYFIRYPVQSSLWFHGPIHQRADELVAQGHAEYIRADIKQLDPTYPDLAISYYELRDHVRSCSPAGFSKK